LTFGQAQSRPGGRLLKTHQKNCLSQSNKI
jgi:hypothetical protein